MKVRSEHLAVTKSARIYTVGEAQEHQDLWIVCHGYGQLAERFIGHFTDLAEGTRLVVAPEALHRFYLDPPPAPAANRRVGATWMTREDRDTDIADNVHYLDSVADHFRADRANRVHVLGFSQGAATAFRWAVLGNSRIDELIMWAGEVPPDVDMKLAAQRLANTRIVFASGRQDEYGGAGKHMNALRTAGINVELQEFEGGHHMDAALLNSIVTRT